MKNVNRIRNPRFALRAGAPQFWSWTARGAGCGWRMEAASDPGRAAMVMECADPSAAGAWRQRIRCTPKHHYRIEADVCVHAEFETAIPDLRMTILFGRDSRSPGAEEFGLRAVPFNSTDVTLRGYLRAPDDARVLEIRIEFGGAIGHALIHEVRVIPIFEPDAKDHVLAVPPPGRAYPPPRATRRAAVWCDAEAPPVLTRLLSLHLGKNAVAIHRRDPADGDGELPAAVFITRRAAPRSLRTLSALERFAADRIVVITPTAFARVAGNGLKVRRIEQPADPLHASIQCACFMTRGFALHDVIPFAAPGAAPASFAQDQFDSKDGVRTFCELRGYQVLLSGETNSQRTSETPIALWKQTTGGALIACDLGALEVPPSTLGESNAAALVLGNILGREQTSIGQYVVPARDEAQFRLQLSDLTAHFPAIRFEGPSGPAVPTSALRVALGDDTAPPGRLSRRRPTVLLRTGISDGDESGAYAALLWLKHLVRPLPFACPHAGHLNSRIRVLWQPLHRPWTAHGIGFSTPRRNGGSPSGAEPKVPGPEQAIEHLIDLTMGSNAALTVRFAHPSLLQERCARLLPALAEVYGRGRFIAYAPTTRGSRDHSDTVAWRSVDACPQVLVDPRLVHERLPGGPAAQGAEIVRIELPAAASSSETASPWRIELAMLVLDQVVGLLCDTLLANHSAHPITLDRTLVLGESCSEYAILTMDAETGAVRESPQPGGGSTIKLQPGQALRTLC